MTDSDVLSDNVVSGDDDANDNEMFDSSLNNNSHHHRHSDHNNSSNGTDHNSSCHISEEEEEVAAAAAAGETITLHHHTSTRVDKGEESCEGDDEEVVHHHHHHHHHSIEEVAATQSLSITTVAPPSQLLPPHITTVKVSPSPLSESIADTTTTNTPLSPPLSPSSPILPQLYIIQQEDNNNMTKFNKSELATPLSPIDLEPITIKLFEVGDMHVDGICNRYDTTWTDDLRGVIAKEDFLKEMNRFHSFLDQSTPGGNYLFYGCMFCCCTAGLSFLPLYYKINTFASKVRRYIDKMNAKRYQERGIEWNLFVYRRTDGKLLSHRGEKEVSASAAANVTTTEGEGGSEGSKPPKSYISITFSRPKRNMVTAAMS